MQWRRGGTEVIAEYINPAIISSPLIYHLFADFRWANNSFLKRKDSPTILPAAATASKRKMPVEAEVDEEAEADEEETVVAEEVVAVASSVVKKDTNPLNVLQEVVEVEAVVVASSAAKKDTNPSSAPQEVEVAVVEEEAEVVVVDEEEEGGEGFECMINKHLLSPYNSLDLR